MVAFVVLAIIVAIILIVVVSNVHVVPQSKAFVIERLGAYHQTWKTGLHVKVPFIDKISKRINLMEQVADFPPQPVITKDNVRMQIDTRSQVIPSTTAAAIATNSQKNTAIFSAKKLPQSISRILLSCFLD